jgi:hypothetical protein
MPRTDALGIPRSPEQADRILSNAERLLEDREMTGGHAAQLTRFLRANSAAWTPASRERLRKVLAELGESAVEPVVAAMTKLPRTDVLDEGELVRRSLPREAAPKLRRFLDPIECGGITPSVRACVLRAVVRSPLVRAAMSALDAAAVVGEGTQALFALRGQE